MTYLANFFLVGLSPPTSGRRLMPWRYKQRWRSERVMRDTRLEGVEAIVERQQRMFTEGYNHGLLLRSENGRLRLTWPHRSIFNGSTPAPFSHRFSVEVIAFGHARHALLTMPYRSTQRCGRAGAAV